ncbi:hypothetical protein [Flavobacterium pallidum]|uniref:Uncharacterized protein n=1 Tax=Flavobacterium pallidum TaxID=2172098 RepID=A0A2S1SF69_9FLAO|nr:hypothetical protein [Flavobacterium pallidum]AWI25056.1 hypothetical protein HYN49_03625 [Flavobacterium pallidum]
MALTPENIEFIDKYLRNSDVIYADIRSEMTDHIATAIEAEMTETGGEFLILFKDYMVQHKKELMKMNRRNGTSSMVVARHYFDFLKKPWMIVFALLNFFLLTVTFRSQTEAFSMDGSFYIFPLIWMAIVLSPQLLVYAVTKKRFYYIERSGFLMASLYQASYFLTLFSEDFSAVGIAISSYISIGYIFYTLYNLRQFYTNKIYLTAIVK